MNSIEATISEVKRIRSKKDQTSSKSGRTLILETGYTGHRPEYIRHLMCYISNNVRLHNRYTFILNDHVRQKLGCFSSSSSYDCLFFSFPEKHKNGFQQSAAEWNIIKDIQELNASEEIIFMDIDRYLWLIGQKGFLEKNIRVSGILFQPFIHFSRGKFASIKIMKQWLKTRLLQKWALKRNHQLENIFILNDRQGVVKLNAANTSLYKHLPDPIDFRTTTDSTPESTREKFGIAGKRNLLVFGSIDSKKNVPTIISAINALPDRFQQTVHLIIAGKISADIKDQITKQIANHDNMSVCVYDGFVTDEERETLFSYSDLVLMPYVNFYGSSGVLGHSIKYSKPVIASQNSIAADMVQEYGAGIVVDPKSESAITNAIVKILFSNAGTWTYDNTNFLKEYTIENFCKTILSGRNESTTEHI